MLQNILYILFVSIVCIAWGLPVVAYTKTKSLTLAFFSGLILLSLVSSWLVLFMPIGYVTLLVLTGILIIIELTWLRKKIQFEFKRIQWDLPLAFFIASCIVFIFLGSGSPVMEDTGLYHIQLIRWNQQYGMIPGLANLYLRDGFYSNWFHLISFFALPFKQQNFLFLNITVCVWFFFFLSQRLRVHLSQTGKPFHQILAVLYFLIAAYMLIEWDLARGNASSTSYDFIVTVLILLVLLMIIENYPLHFIVLFGLAAPFFKVTGATSLVLILCYFLITKQNIKKYFITGLVFALFFVPYLVKNYTQTGYPFYPYTLLSNVSTPDWKVPAPLLARFTDYMNISNKYINTEIPEQAWNDKSLGWVRPWWQHLTRPDRYLIAFTLLSILVSFFIPAFRKKENRNIRIVYYTSVLLVLPWFFSSPDPRFIYGILLFLAFLPLAYLCAYAVKKIIIQAGLIILIIGGLGYIAMSTKKITRHNLIRPTAIIQPARNEIKIGAFSFYLPERVSDNWNIRCYDTPLPCIYQANPYLETRGNTIQQGFRMKPVTDSVFILKFIY